MKGNAWGWSSMLLFASFMNAEQQRTMIRALTLVVPESKRLLNSVFGKAEV